MTKKYAANRHWPFSLLLLLGIHLPVGALDPAEDAESDVPKQGELLVAGRYMRDPRFVQSVIFLVSVDKNGILGLMINHPSVYQLKDLVPSMKDDEAGEHEVYVGGPVELQRISVLYRAGQPTPGSLSVVDDIYFSDDKRVILERTGTASATVKILAGHAGWAPDQLEREIEAGAWHLVSADPSIVFREDAENLWQELTSAPGLWVQSGVGGRLGFARARVHRQVQISGVNDPLSMGGWRRITDRN